MGYRLTFTAVFTTLAIKSLAEQQNCNGLIFNQVYYDRQVIGTKLGRPNNLVYHKYSGTLLFSHTIQTGSQVDFGIMACNLPQKKCDEVKGVPGGYAIAYDAGNDDIYLGGHDGIYKYNFLSLSGEFFAEDGRSIWEIFVRNNFYYILYPTQKLYVYQDKRFVQVTEAMHIEIDHFFVSKKLDVYFSNKTALYKVEKPEKETVVLNDNIVVRQITEDSFGDVYFCASDGIYIEDRPYERIKKVAEVDQAFGITFDENENIIYSDKTTIYKLFLSESSKRCYNYLDRHDNLLYSNPSI